MEPTPTLSARERIAEAVVGGTFALAALLLLVLAGDQPPAEPHVLGLSVLAIAAASRVRFDIGTGFTVPITLVFIPVLLLLPAPLVPVVTMLGLLCGRLPDVVRGAVPVARLVLVPGNTWFAIGPAVVLALAGPAAADERGVLVLLAAIAAQAVTDFVPHAARERMLHGTSLRALVDDARWVQLVDLALACVGYLVARAVAPEPALLLLALPLLGLLSVFARERSARLEQMTELNAAYRGTALVLGDVVEADDQYTGDHCRDVVELALEVGDELGLRGDSRRNLEFGALLHDVGKVVIPKEIINKPGKLTDAEFELVKTHTVEGQRMLDRVGGFMAEVGVVVRHHHERWDGRGYPDGLVGEAIPIEARIISVCDTYNAMTTTRSYRAALPVDTAFAELRRCAGGQFDPEVVEAALAVLDRTPAPVAEPVVAVPAPQPLAA